ncbi:MAG: Sulfite dehydrogenase cytochrome subunit SoxD, partial [uncultured Gemmatimonadaceae bacterium]
LRRRARGHGRRGGRVGPRRQPRRRRPPAGAGDARRGRGGLRAEVRELPRAARRGDGRRGRGLPEADRPGAARGVPVRAGSRAREDGGQLLAVRHHGVRLHPAGDAAHRAGVAQRGRGLRAHRLPARRERDHPEGRGRRCDVAAQGAHARARPVRAGRSGGRPHVPL